VKQMIIEELNTIKELNAGTEQQRQIIPTSGVVKRGLSVFTLQIHAPSSVRRMSAI